MGTGLALLIVPSLVGQLLLGEELSGIAEAVARVAGIALIGLGIACWPGPPLAGMLTYSTIVALYLAYLGFAAGLAFPERGTHLLGRAARQSRNSGQRRSAANSECGLARLELQRLVRRGLAWLASFLQARSKHLDFAASRNTSSASSSSVLKRSAR